MLCDLQGTVVPHDIRHQSSVQQSISSASSIPVPPALGRSYFRAVHRRRAPPSSSYLDVKSRILRDVGRLCFPVAPALAAQVSGALFSLSPDPGEIKDLSHSSINPVAVRFKLLGDSLLTTLGIISSSLGDKVIASALADCTLLRSQSQPPSLVSTPCHETYSGVVLSSRISGMDAMSSRPALLMVESLQRGDFVGPGDSQFDQSLSSI